MISPKASMVSCNLGLLKKIIAYVDQISVCGQSDHFTWMVGSFDNKNRNGVVL